MSVKILLDLSSALYGGYCGIAQDNRLLLKIFNDLPNTQVEGLLFSSPKQGAVSYKKVSSNFKKNYILQKNVDFFYHLTNEELPHNSIIFRLIRNIKLVKFYFSLITKKNFTIFPIEPMYNKVLWRLFLNKTLPFQQIEKITKLKFNISEFNHYYLAMNMFFQRNIYFRSENYDFVVFSDINSAKVAKKSIKIIRYHDALPLTDPDTFSTNKGILHLNALKACINDSVFVCNSEPTREDLLKIFPAIAERTFTIPCALPTNYSHKLNKQALHIIIQNRYSTLLLAGKKQSALYQKLIAQPFEYILSLATLEPRKNYVSLIRAWEKLSLNKNRNLKLIIVANPGWKSTEIEKAMKPHVEQGNIIHLEKLTPEEIPYVYSHAKAFVFPSYNEGFGFPPMEAMQCGCPTIVSDIPAHRWVMGDASYYCDPYSIDSIADAIEKVIYSEEAVVIQQQLIQKGYERIQLYAQERIANLWQELFIDLKSNPKWRFLQEN